MEAELIKTSRAEMIEESIERWRPKLTGKVAVVTGGARGLGRGMVEGLIRAGVKVAAADKTWEGDDEFRNTLESSGNMAVQMDVTKDAELDAAYAAVMDRYGTTDILINNAAIVTETQFPPLGHVPVLETTDRDWEVAFDVNVFGLLKATRRFLQPMLAQESGCIITVVSSGLLAISQGSGWFPYRARAGWEMPYQATKAAASALSFFLAAELWDQGIAINQVMPGHTRASWFDSTARGYQERGQGYGGRPVIPEHIVPITLFLSAQDKPAEGGVSGLLYNTPDWNYENGYGARANWLDYDMPPDLEEQYKQADAMMAEAAGHPAMRITTPAMRR